MYYFIVKFKKKNKNFYGNFLVCNYAFFKINGVV